MIRVLIAALCLLTFVSCARYHTPDSENRNAMIQTHGNPAESYQHGEFRLDCYDTGEFGELYLYKKESLIDCSAYHRSTDMDWSAICRSFFLHHFDSEFQSKVTRRHFEAGDSELAVFFILGSPDSINRQDDDTLERWVYNPASEPRYVYVRDGIVEDSQAVKN